MLVAYTQTLLVNTLRASWITARSPFLKMLNLFPLNELCLDISISIKLYLLVAHMNFENMYS